MNAIMVFNQQNSLMDIFAVASCKPAYVVPVPSQDKLGGLLQERHLP